ncbi:phage exclusion lipoprotein Cor [Citrobacter freundii]|uniref:phage exclusion lipoprotein Cor n=1 Tax=Citrobacter freundii TaxID=546 RepID=UPI0018C6FC0A|nr:cor protein [Citrobacter freundii]MDT7290258.1 cor protein [Citrobacter freundii]HBV8019191.1 cor protein [Citrobacter freundii]HCR3322355.1 cor protein [Citrobacter freundii]HEF0028611.1 cor protein [Citrobacter freundii]HEG1870621.1 cor protein [Citrobacter freundii]
MKNIIIPVIACLVLSACSGPVLEKLKPVCQAESVLGGQPQLVQIYGVRKVANQTEYRAGYPFNWRWVNKNNFTSSNCP